MARTERSGKVLLAVLVTALLALAACSGDDEDSSASDTVSEDDGGETMDVAGGAPTTVSGQGSGSDGGGTVTDVGDIDLVAAEVDRKIIYRGDIAAEVDDVVPAVRSARDEVAAEGGYVFAQEVSGNSAHVVLKVPAVRFDAAFDAVLGIGDVTSQSIEAEDVSEQFTDLESRKATLETSIARLRGFLDATTNVDEISRLESELTNREAERDVIAGQLRVLQDRTSFATISVSYTSDEEGDAALADESSGPPGFGRGLEVGWDAVVLAAGITATAGGFILPFLPVIVAAGAFGWWWRRRRTTELAGLADRPS